MNLIALILAMTPIQYDCSMVSEKIGLMRGVVQMPITGSMVMESHYLTTDWKGGYPKTAKENITPHLLKSCQRVHSLWRSFPVFANLSADCRELYRSNASREWTPAEGGGAIGAGSVSDKFPVDYELATGNMNWAPGQRPPRGTKFIVKAKDGRAFVLGMGYETGPGELRWIGGMSVESSYYMKGATDHLLLGRAKDQSIPYGPVRCKQPKSL